MPRFRTTLAYRGTDFQGFQRQPEDKRTVQRVVEAAVGKITQQDVTVLAAGRTDSGVHAQGQVIAFDVSWRHTEAELLRAINAVLPDDVALLDLYQQDDFHPRFDARSRLYRYRVLACEQRQPLLWPLTWQVMPPLDFDAMSAAAALLVGEHDFAAFGTAPQGDNTVRHVFRSEWSRARLPDGLADGQFFEYQIEATAFLYHMVRRVVGMMVDVGRGALTVEAFERVFRSCDLAQASVLAPSRGLSLENVRYGDDDREPVSPDT